MIAASGWPASDTMASHGVCGERASDGRRQSIELVCQPLEGKQRSCRLEIDGMRGEEMKDDRYEP
jgi:hypothetical protein